jgi:hypothetical protein
LLKKSFSAAGGQPLTPPKKGNEGVGTVRRKVNYRGGSLIYLSLDFSPIIRLVNKLYHKDF